MQLMGAELVLRAVSLTKPLHLYHRLQHGIVVGRGEPIVWCLALLKPEDVGFEEKHQEH